MKKQYILIINAGSSTLKFKVFKYDDLKLVKQGIVERIGLIRSFIILNGDKEINEVDSHEQAFRLVLRSLDDIKDDIVLVGHRVVHGGEEFTEPVLITKRVLKKIEKFNKLAPLHNPVSYSVIKASQKYLKNIKDVAVFDTGFFKTLPEKSFIYPIPYKFYQRHKIRRYGFHGISHQYMACQSAKKLRRKLNNLNLITCHLGSGCSVTAIKKGQAIDTSMGFTPLEGLVMLTRSGSIDPAIPIYLINKLKMSADEVNDLLNKRSGLFGLSGSMDMREILIKAGFKVPGFEFKEKIRKKDKELANLTIDIFVYKIVKYIGSYKTILGNADAIAFTGGIGEKSTIIRNKILKYFPKTKALVIPANEELMIAEEGKKLVE